jgi:hypothetical protein
MRLTVFLCLLHASTAWRLGTGRQAAESSRISSTSSSSSTARFHVAKALSALVVATGMVGQFAPVMPAAAYDRLNAATAAGTRVNSDAESLLRYGLPIPNDKEIRDVQANLEQCKMNLKTRRVEFAKQDIKNVRQLLAQNENKILKTVSPKNQDKAVAALEKLKADLDPLQAVLEKETSTGSGSVQERTALDAAFVAQRVAANDLTEVEVLLVPDGFKREIPEEYAGLPALQVPVPPCLCFVLAALVADPSLRLHAPTQTGAGRGADGAEEARRGAVQRRRGAVRHGQPAARDRRLQRAADRGQLRRPGREGVLQEQENRPVGRVRGPDGG